MKDDKVSHRNAALATSSGQKFHNLPNILTTLRVVLALPFMILFFVNTLPAKIATLAIFVLASATDFVDGRLARKTGSVSDFGAFLDPLADKTLVNLCFLCLVTAGAVPIWMFAVILVRDFAVDGMRMLAAKSGLTLSASKAGKLKTMVQMWTLALILLNLILENQVLGVATSILLYIVVILTLISGLQYLIKGFKNPKIFKGALG